MPFPLEPPYTGRSSMWRIETQEVVSEGPLLARSRQSSRWHRVKSGVCFLDQDRRISWQYWCGQHASSSDTIGRDDLPTDGLPICGPCEGRALGAGYNGTAAIIAGEALLLFEPRSKTAFRRPQQCPGTSRGLFLPSPLPAAPNVAVCAVCGLLCAIGTKRRGTGYSADYWEALKPHQPGPALVDPCPFHAWDELIVRDDHALCRCNVIRAEAAS